MNLKEKINEITKLKEKINEITKGEKISRRYLNCCQDKNAELLFRYMLSKQIDHLSFVVDEEYYDGLTVEFSIEDNEFVFSLTDNGFKNNKLLYVYHYSMMYPIYGGAYRDSYPIEKYKNVDMKKIFNYGPLSPTCVIQYMIETRRKAIKIGDKFKIFNVDFQVTSIDDDMRVRLDSSDNHSFLCQFTAFEDNDGLLIRPEWNGYDGDPLFLFKYVENN